jgi:hypothetical protein
MVHGVAKPVVGLADLGGQEAQLQKSARRQM